MPKVFANSVHLNYVEAGTGEPPLLILHGLGGSHDMWLTLLPAFARSRRVIAGDHRGHGDSDKPAGPYTVKLLAQDWIAALDALGVARAHLLGLSLGGAVAMRIAAEHPQRVAKLILENTWAHPHADFVAMLKSRLTLLENADVRAYADVAIPQIFSEDYAQRHPDVVDAYRARAAKAEPFTLAAAVDACLTHDMRGSLGSIKAPTLVMVGARDRLTPVFHGEYLAAAIPGARLRLFEGSAHFPHVEQETAFRDAVETFLADPPLADPP
jgi:3-oxoadipate enol-lactonase